MKLFILCITLLLAGCSPPDYTRGVDNCTRQELFKSCLREVPTGPASTVSNDSSEVIDSCDSSAYYQSIKPIETISKACLGSKLL